MIVGIGTLIKTNGVKVSKDYKRKRKSPDNPFDIPEWMFGPSVEARNALQNCGLFHPYTCGNSDCRSTLRATEYGWICDKCGYTQDSRR